MIPPKHHFELTSEGALLPKEILLELILNRHSEKLEANPHSLLARRSFKIKINRPLLTDSSRSEEMDFDEHLRICVVEKCRLDEQDRLRFVRAYLNLQLSSSNRNTVRILRAYMAQLLQPNYYELLLENVPNYPRDFFNTIEKDVTRTFQSDNQSQSSNEQRIRQLKNVLQVYAIRNPHILYCQGFNFIAAYFLTHGYSQQQTFWLMVQLIEQILPVGYYTDMDAVICFTTLVQDLVRQVLPELANLLERNKLELSILLVPWLICLYTKSVSSELADHIIATLFVEGKVALMKTALTIFKLVGPKLEEPDQEDEFHLMVRQFHQEVKDIAVKDFKVMYDQLYINHYFLEVLTNAYIRQREEGSALTDREEGTTKHNWLPSCNPKYPVCMHVIEVNKRFRGIARVDTLKISAQLGSLLVEDYFDNCRTDKETCLRKGCYRKDIGEVQIGRHTHICNKSSDSVKRKLSKLELERMIAEILSEQPFPLPLLQQENDQEDFQERVLRRTTIKIVEVISTILQTAVDEPVLMSQPFLDCSQDPVKQVIIEQSCSQLAKRNSLIRLPEEVQKNSVLIFFRKLF